MQNEQITWMKGLSDHLSLAEISIPGTHDSAAFKRAFTQSWQRQQWDFLTQLNNGVRYFDLRLKYVPQNESVEEQIFHFYHGNAFVGGAKQGFMIIKQFLTDHPSEFLILQIQQEYSNYQSHKFGLKFVNYLKELSFPALYEMKSIPLVKNVRGKAWLIEAAHVSMGFFKIDTDKPIRMKIRCEDQDNKYIMQNAWKDPQNYMNWSQTKEKAIRDHLNQMCQKDCLKINFISWSPGLSGCHNQFFEKLIPFYSHLGISLMDYPTQQLIKKIIEKNFQK